MLDEIRIFVSRLQRGRSHITCRVRTTTELKRLLKTHRETADNCTYLVHVGIKELSLLQIDVVLKSGFQVLFSGSAKFAFVEMYRCHDKPSYNIEGIPLYREMAPYKKATPTEFLKDGWLEDFARLSPKNRELLRSLNIIDEYSYADKESKLSSAERIHVSKFRCSFLSLGYETDPSLIARLLPKWLMKWDILRMDISVTIRTALKSRGISTVEMLGLSAWEDIRREFRIGKNLSRKLSNSLINLISEKSFDQSVGQKSGLIDIILDRVSTLTDTERSVVLNRSSISGLARSTVMIAKNFGVSEQRIRQIESIALDRMKSDGKMASYVIENFHRVRQNGFCPLKLDKIGEVDRWFCDERLTSRVFVYFISKKVFGNINVIKVNGRDYLSLIDQKEWLSIKTSSRRLLKASLGDGTELKIVKEHVRNGMPDQSREFFDVLWTSITRKSV